MMRTMQRLGGLIGLLLIAQLTIAGDIPLRIITFNCENGIASSPEARAAAGNMLTIIDFDGDGPNDGLRPSILCIQESRSLADLQSFRDDYLPGYTVRRGNPAFQDPGGNTQAIIYAPELTLLQIYEWNHGGPRRHHRMVFEVEGSDEILVVYNVHFKAFQDGYSQNIRRIESNNLANRVALDWAHGVDIDYDGIPDFPMSYYLVVGDLNQHDFTGDTISALLDGGDNDLPTGLNDVRVETLAGQQFPGIFIGGTWNTRTGMNSRLDYILASDAIFAQFDLDGDGVWTQDELNAAGFVYHSGDDGGLLASGQPDATPIASDHAPVIVDFVMPATPAIPGDVNGDGVVDQADLALLLAAYGSSEGDPNWNPNADFNSDGVINQADLAVLLANYGYGL